MKRDFCYKLCLAYDGTRYEGWQAQPSGKTVQQTIEAPLEKLFGQQIRVHGAGRTDQGVQAHGQVATFHAVKRIEPRVVLRALNASVPDDIRVRQVALAAAGFHARFSATSKEYRYQIVTSKVMSPFLRHYALHHPRPLDVTAMRRAARVFAGRHDFAALSAHSRREIDSTVRTVSRMAITKRGDLITVVVRADGFLYKMVRSLVGALLKAGRREATVGEMARYLRARQRTHYIETAPAHGLFLWKVWY